MRGARVAIIGAGPAGCAAGFHLARAGFPVTILEARLFPRVKVCGEFISPAATGLLEAIVEPEALRAAGARRVESFVLRLGPRERTLRMPSPAWALSRRSLDSLLVARAREAGAVVVQPAAVVGVDHGPTDAERACSVTSPAGGPCSIHLASGDTLHADLVLHADGHGRFCPSPPTPMAHDLIALKCHFAPSTPITGVTIRSAPGGYVGTVQVEPSDGHPSLATLALVARKRLLGEHANDLDALVGSLWGGWEPSRRTSDWLTCGVARSGYQPSGHSRAFRLGNAAAAVDPVGGEGIGLGLWSGTLLGELLIRVSAGLESPTLAAVSRRYAALYRRRVLTRRPACFLAAEALTHPRLIAALWPLLGLERLTLAPWYAATGKPWRSPRSWQPAT